MIKRLVFIIWGLILCGIIGGCVTPPDVKDKVQTEVAIHSGYVRLIETRPELTKDDVVKMVKASERAWRTLDHRVNDAPAPAPLPAPEPVTGTAR